MAEFQHHGKQPTEKADENEKSSKKNVAIERNIKGRILKFTKGVIEKIKAVFSTS
ncbi:hypothetical protein R2R35_05310 [Anaerocolumna sp. AGMB13020]|uniref:hypothetical protein n=1 Tax=Anaerocolumna sp. AGMB13020 TaxID=3081750 RepID=UPI002954686D|nr:hypothetical protein [Anaerocolumna sp. AGMB13020]WOO37923.1 hypothetical protein R2R35_05310 [Anaerocolumna sp. AGMB13020]